MKIGILTHHYVNNFGAFLQAYSLMKYISETFLDADVQIINYINRKHYLINCCGWLRFYRDKETYSIWKHKLKVSKVFARERKKYFKLSKKCRTVKDVDALSFDYIVVGSDEVWNYYDNKANDKIKFGIGLSCEHLIAYAPSVGQANSNIPKYVSDGIKKFQAVSARDKFTEDFLRHFRSDVVHVVDPTFLTDIPVEPIDGIKSEYILFYYCDGLDRDEKNKIIDFAKHNSLSVYGAGEGDRTYSDITIDITPFQWVWLFKNAKYVITGTFHGVVFSLLHHKNFACYLTNPSRVAKVSSLLEDFKLTDRISEGKAESLLETMQKDIDYSIFDVMAQEKTHFSKEYLRKALNHE